MRHHHQAYDAVLAGQSTVQRQLIEETLAGLRLSGWISGEADLAEFIDPGEPAGQTPITDWTWKPLVEPALVSRAPRGQAWEMSRYRAYQTQLAGHPIGEIFGRTAGFLRLAAADVPTLTDISARRRHLEERCRSASLQE